MESPGNTQQGEGAAGLGQHRHAGATAQPFSNQLSFLHCFKIKKNNKKKKIKNTQSSPNPFLPSGDPDPCRQVPAGSTPQQLVEQGVAQPKHTLFCFQLEIWSVACWATPTGRGTGAVCPRRMEGDGAGLGWLQGNGRGFFPASFRLGAAGAALPSHPGEAAVPVPRSHHTPRCQPQPQGEERGGRHGAGSRGSRIPAAESRLARQARHGAAGTSHCQAGHPSSQHTPAGRNGSAQHCGMGAARTWNGLSSTRDLCGNPGAVRFLWSEGSPAMAQSSPNLSPSAEDTQVSNTTQPSPGQLAQPWEGPRLPKPV